jgi:hypothetical protein
VRFPEGAGAWACVGGHTANCPDFPLRVTRVKFHRLSKLAGLDGRLGDTEGNSALAYPDLAEALQARILADLKAETVRHTPSHRSDPDERRTVGPWKPKSLD